MIKILLVLLLSRGLRGNIDTSIPPDIFFTPLHFSCLHLLPFISFTLIKKERKKGPNMINY